MLELLLTVALQQVRTSLDRCPCAHLICKPASCDITCHIVDLVQNYIDSVSLVLDVHHKLRHWQRYKRILNITYLQHNDFLSC